MLRSIRTRLLLACVMLVFLTAGSLMWFAHKDTIIALRGSERRTLNNVLFLLERELNASHTEALRAKVRAVDEVKDALARAAKSASRAVSSLFGKPEGEVRAALAFLAANPADPALSLRFFQLAPQGEARLFAGEKTLPESARVRLQALLRDEEAEFFYDPDADGTLFRLQRAGDVLVVCSRPLADVETAAAKRMDEVGMRFKNLLREVRVQRTGFAAVLDAKGELVAGPAQAAIPSKLRETLAAGAFSGASRRVMVLPADAAPGNDAGEVLYLLGYFRPLRWHILLAAPLNELEEPAVALVAGQLGITGAVTACALLLGLVLAGRIAGPVRRLSGLAKDLPRRDILTLDAEELAKELPLRRADEVGELSRSFEYMVRELRSNVEQLVESTALRQRMEKELQVARDIQYGILPGALSGRTDLDLYAFMWTAKEVGGDLYDYFFLDPRRLCFVIGDVSDKSIPAALFMSMTVTLTRIVMHEFGMSPERAMARINDTLARDNPRNMFVTLCVGILDLDTGDLAWASGGHMPPVRVSEGGAVSLAASQDMVVGVFEDLPYQLLQDRLLPGETLFFYTDGVSEGMNAGKELFGETRLLAELAPLAGTASAAMAEIVRSAVLAHANGAEQSDDIAVMAIRYAGKV